MSEEAEIHILVVDNEQKICDLIKLFIQSSKIDTHIVMANNALQALQKLQNQPFDLLITDHSMVGKTGIELIAQLKKSPQYMNLTTLLISGCLTDEDVIRAMGVGCRQILVKPFSRSQLLSKVSEVLKVEL